MSADKAFVDTHVLLYLLSSDAPKADRAQACVAAGGVISVQVLNEFASVTLRKFKAPWPAVHESLDLFRQAFRVEPLTVEVHERGLEIAERYKLAVYDGQILAAAALAGCKVVYSEDMQHDLRVDEDLVVRNPFRD